MTLNPSRNTLPLANHTKSVDLEHLKNTQHSLATEIQKIEKRLHLIKAQLKSIQLQSYSTLTLKSKAWCESWKLEIKFAKPNSQIVSYRPKAYNKLYILPKDSLKHLKQERIQLEII